MTLLATPGSPLSQGFPGRDNDQVVWPSGGSSREAPAPSLEDARRLAHDLLIGEGTRLAHVRTAGRIASRLGLLLPEGDAELLIAAATLHDIGYSPRIAHTGFHPLDGGRFLVAEGFPPRLAGLVAHHSLAHLHADPDEAAALAAEFPREEGLISDALAYADMHSAPDGGLITAERRLADIATRHASRRQAHRAAQLRISIARVGAALLDLGAQPAPAGSTPGGRWVARHSWPAGHAASERPVEKRVRGAFQAWIGAEAAYRDELVAFDGRAGREARAAALALARLRVAADARRDNYFRQALQEDAC